MLEQFPEPAQQKIEVILEFYNSLNPDEHAGAGYYCAIDAGGNATTRYTDAGCFGPLLGRTMSHDIVAVVLHPRLAGRVGARQSPTCTLEEFAPIAQEYTKWVTERSMWAPLFALKNQEGAFLLNVAHQCPMYVGMAMSAARYSGEYRQFVQSWYELRKLVDDETAFILSHIIFPTSDDTWHIKTGDNLWWCDHIFVISDQLRPRLARKFINREFTPSNRKVMLDLHKPEYHASLFGTVDYNEWWKTPKVKPIKRRVGWIETVAHNSFLNDELPNVVEALVTLNKLEKSQ